MNGYGRTFNVFFMVITKTQSMLATMEHTDCDTWSHHLVHTGNIQITMRIVLKAQGLL